MKGIKFKEINMVAVYVVLGFIAIALIFLLTPKGENAYGIATVTSDEEIVKIAQNNKIQAIKEYRALHGVGLKDAKDAVEYLMRSYTGATDEPSSESSDNGDKLEEIKSLLKGGNKIAAIKEYRALYGVGLKDAKEAVERLEF